MNKMNTHEQQFSRICATLDLIVDGALLKLEGRNLRTVLCAETLLSLVYD